MDKMSYFPKAVDLQIVENKAKPKCYKFIFVGWLSLKF